MNEDFFEQLASCLGTAVFTVQLPDHLVQYANPSVETILGYTREDCLGKNTEQFYPSKEEFLKFGRLVKQALEQKRPIMTTEQLLRRKDGTIIETEITVSFIWNAGVVDKAISVVKDITKRKALAEATERIKAQLRTMIDSYPAWISCVDTEGNYFIANNYYVRTFNLPIEQIEGHNFKEFFPPDLYQKHSKLMMQALESEAPVEWEDQHKFEEDRITYISGFYTPLFDSKGSIWGVSAFGLDISHLKRVEQEKEAIIDKLQTALAEVRKLRGILPICSSCKKIRDDNGSWNWIETYITEHSEAEFSHGLCDECAKALYPDYVDRD
jgi:PAS domain S-box-containing protein